MTTQQTPTFKSWLMQQSERKDAVGEFARMAARDPKFPDEATDARRTLRRYEASEATMAACADAIREYNQIV